MQENIKEILQGFQNDFRPCSECPQQQLATNLLKEISIEYHASEKHDQPARYDKIVEKIDKLLETQQSDKVCINDSCSGWDKKTENCGCDHFKKIGIDNCLQYISE